MTPVTLKSGPTADPYLEAPSLLARFKCALWTLFIDLLETLLTAELALLDEKFFSNIGSLIGMPDISVV